MSHLGREKVCPDLTSIKNMTRVILSYKTWTVLTLQTDFVEFN